MNREGFCKAYPVLYHGTAASHLPEIIAKGLLPRSKHKRASNWTHSIESNPHTVYLTDAYAHYFAFSATSGARSDSVVLEIDTTKLAYPKLVADEDFLEQATRGSRERLRGAPEWLATGDMKRRTRWFRAHASEYGDAFMSLQHLGTCGYMSTVPWRAVSRVAIMSQALAGELALMFDPTISLLNYKLVGERYRTFARSLFDPDIVVPGALDTFMPMTIKDASEGQPLIMTNDLATFVYAPHLHVSSTPQHPTTQHQST